MSDRLSRPSELECGTVACSTYLLRAYELSLTLDLDRVDVQIVADQIDDAGGHVAGAIHLQHPEWGDLDAMEFADEALQTFRALRPQIDPKLVAESGCVRCIELAIEEARRASDLAVRSEGEWGRQIAFQFHLALDHLECALFVLDPVRFFAAVEGATGTGRATLASRLARLELEVAEHRESITEAI